MQWLFSRARRIDIETEILFFAQSHEEWLNKIESLIRLSYTNPTLLNREKILDRLRTTDSLKIFRVVISYKVMIDVRSRWNPEVITGQHLRDQSLITLGLELDELFEEIVEYFQATKDNIVLATKDNLHHLSALHGKK